MTYRDRPETILMHKMGKNYVVILVSVMLHQAFSSLW